MAGVPLPDHHMGQGKGLGCGSPSDYRERAQGETSAAWTGQPGLRNTFLNHRQREVSRYSIRSVAPVVQVDPRSVSARRHGYRAWVTTRMNIFPNVFSVTFTGDAPNGEPNSGTGERAPNVRDCEGGLFRGALLGSGLCVLQIGSSLWMHYFMPSLNTALAS